ncbi:MAG: ABC transporter ATP-binding protein [Thermodesulfobacteriota bacterium]
MTGSEVVDFDGDLGRMLLKTENISVSIGGLHILRHVHVEMEEGRITSIIGPNGAGKTTLFNVITGRMAPSGGRVWFREKDITGWPPHEIARTGIARSFQITNIFKNMTVFDNICIAAQTKFPFRTSIFSQVSEDVSTPAEAETVLDLIGLGSLKDKLARELSHGDQRRLEIGMSLAIGPDFLMLDEPTSGMSPAETASTIDLIRSLRERVTICIIEHKMGLVMTVSDKIVVLNLGEKIAEGSPQDIASNNEVQRVYLGTP